MVKSAAAPGQGLMHVIDLLGTAMAQRDAQIGALSRQIKMKDDALQQAQVELDALRANHPPTPEETPAR